MSLKPIPFDSLCLAAAVRDMAPLIGGRLQRIVQPNAQTLVLGIYAEGREWQLLLSCAPNTARAHLSKERPASTGDLPELGASMRRLLDGSRLAALRQIGFDRMLELTFVVAARASFVLMAELTGKHANLVLVDPEGRIIAAAHSVAKRQSVRPVFPGARYEAPPFPARKPFWHVRSLAELEAAEGASPFLRNLLRINAASDEDVAKRVQELGERVATGNFTPVQVDGLGAYPVSVARLGYAERPAESYSEAADRHFRALEARTEIEALRVKLLNPIRRVLLSRELAQQELEQAADAARNARRLQEKAELILAFASSISAGQESLETMDYEGNPVKIALDPELAPLENAQRLFEKAKHAKARSGHVVEQMKRIAEDRIALLGALRRIEDATEIEVLRAEEGKARERRWLNLQSGPPPAKEDRPYEGHRIRELLGPGGIRVLFGENATSNDYLTQRVARPNDWWLHVRGASSAHVVVATGNRPERVGREGLEFAARIAVANSGSKHSGYVPVDYTLKKYVRKPRGAPPGTVTYTHEKTLHIAKP